jgi:chaperonin GroEL (HSP60 family)
LLKAFGKPLLRRRVEEGQAGEERAVTAWVADWVAGFAGPTYGPHGLDKCIEQGDGSGRILKSGASALREAGIRHPDLQPYLDLAHAVQEHAGDQATGAILLAAHLMRAADRARQAGVPVAALLDGYQLALRQARAELNAMASRDAAGASLRSVLPGQPDLAATVLRGLAHLSLDGEIRLDAVDVRAEADGPAWLPGVAVAPQHLPRDVPAATPVRVLLLTDDWKPGPWNERMSYRMTADHALAAWTDGEDRRRTEALGHLQRLGVNLVVCAREVNPELAERAATRGITVWNDAPRSALDRLRGATGATPVPRLEEATAADLGTGTLVRRPGHAGWMVQGAGPSATLVVPAHNAMAQDRAKDDAERLLRAAGAHLGDPSCVPGGGRWQRHLAKALRAAADAGPGKTPWALRAAADGFARLADLLVANAGHDPIVEPLLPDADGVLDPAAPVRIAVTAAFETAIQQLRIDGRYRKRASSQRGLRGSDDAPGSASGLPGDIPPLM